MKKRVGAIVLIGLLLATALCGCESMQRFKKSVSSDFNGGLNRTITVYDYTGNVIKTYEGKFDVEASESRVYFDDENGKRVIIYNALVINEEK